MSKCYQKNIVPGQRCELMNQARQKNDSKISLPVGPLVSAERFFDCKKGIKND